MPEGFPQCKSYLPHRACILLQVLFHLEESDHPRGMAMEKTLSRPSPASSVHPAEAEVKRLFSVSWKRPTGTRRCSLPPPHASISYVCWEGHHFTWVTTAFKWLFLSFFSQIHQKEICRKCELVAGDWPVGSPLHDSTLVSKWTLKGLHLQSLLNVTSWLYLPASAQLQAYVWKFRTTKNQIIRHRQELDFKDL